jgi:hypothetical protein
MFLCSVKALVLWVLLMFLGTNLLGFVVRGLFSQGAPSVPTDATPGVERLLASEARKFRVFNVVSTVLAAIATAAYLWALNRYCGGTLAVVAGLMIMASRLPDLLREIRTGVADIRSRTPVDYVAISLLWLSLPALWFALC